MNNRLSDVQLLQREFYNPNKYKVFFTRMLEKDEYIGRAKGPLKLGPAFAVLEPDKHLYLPHGYYLIQGEGLPLGEPISLVMNLEKLMNQGNKIPSNIRGFNE